VFLSDLKGGLVSMANLSRRQISAAAAGMMFGAVGSATAEPPQAEGKLAALVGFYETPPGGELVDRIRLAHDPYQFFTLFQLKLPSLRQGDIVHAHCQFEVTNNCFSPGPKEERVNVMVFHAMLIHSRATKLNDDPKPDWKIVMPCAYAGENVTPGMHHGFRTLVGTTRIEREGDAWLSVVIYAASDAAAKGSVLEIEKPYGGLSALVYRA
jgi:hypothetical protein